MKKNIFALFIGILGGLLLLEGLLRIYNPVPVRIRGNKIVLPVFQKYVYKNDVCSKLDKVIIHTKNSLGFRGPEIPANFSDYLSIITIGGSTTECSLLSDGHDWPNILRKKLQKALPLVWLNNAGLDGHSTFGHQILLDDYIVKIKPRIVIFLVGNNDVGRGDLHAFETRIFKNQHTNFLDFICEHSELVNTARNIWRVVKANKIGVGHFYTDLTKCEKMQVTDEQIKSTIEKHKKYLKNYKKRLENLVNTCKKNGVEPVLVTQPIVFGDCLDPTTGINLAEIKTPVDLNSKCVWEVMEKYNDVTRTVAKENNVFLVDLSILMPKDTRYYYDKGHYTNDGSEKVAEIIFQKLAPHLKAEKY